MHRSTGNTGRPGGVSSDNVDSSTYIRTGDSVGFATSTTTGRIVKHYLSTGFGTQYCTVLLEPSDDQEPTVIWRHIFEIFDAISPHAIHGWNEKESQAKGCRVLLYGQAILLKTAGGYKYLRCLPHHAGRVGKYKMNDFHSHYLIGFSSPNQKVQADEYCWFVIRPATNQRSEGEKVKAGDDILLVNVGTGRYLSLPHERPVAYDTTSTSTSLSIDFDDDTFTDIPVATFSPWTWIIDIIRSHSADAGSLNGYVNAGDPIQLKVAHRDDELMSIPLSSLEDPLAVNDAKRMVYFEDKSVKLELRSLWLLMLSGVSYGRAFIEYGQPFRLRHMVSGMYLGVDQNRQLVLVDGKNAQRDTCSFCFVKKGSPVPPINYKREGMGTPTIKLGESEVSLYHISSKLWVTLELMGPSLRRLRTGFSGPPRALLSDEPHGLSFTTLKAMHIALSTVVCNELETVMLAFSEAMRRIQGQSINDRSIKSIKESAEEKTLAKLNESLVFLVPPNKEIMDIHNYQDLLMKLRNRQTRLLNHGTANMVFALLRKTVSHYGHDVTSNGLQIQQALCRILANVVKGNRLACRRFANRESIRNMFELINNPSLLHPMLEVMDCLLEESPEVLLSLTEENVRQLFTLLYCHGRDDKVMSLLGRLPVCQGVAMREKQLQICHLLQDSHQLLLHTSLMPKLYSMYANVFLSSKDNVDATKLYFELQWTRSEAARTKPCIRIGCVQYLNFLPYPKSKGSMATQGGIGDDGSSVSFDGQHIWINSEKYGHQSIPLTKGQFKKQSFEDEQDVTVYGCCLDLEKGTLMFTVNGQLFPLQVNFHLNENTIAVPAVSFTGGVENARLCFGSDYGDLYFAPPIGYQPLSCFIEQKANGKKEKICLYPFVCVGDSNERILNGPMQYNDSVWFRPSVPDLTNVIIPSRLHQLINDLAVESHNVWAVSEIDSGHSSPNLTAFPHLPKELQLQRLQEGRSLIASLISLGCRISPTDTHPISHQDLPDDPYLQLNGFKPCPLELLDELPASLQSLVTELSVIEHNKWSKERISEGWKYGVTTCPQVMQDCCLVPYQCLPLEIKKKYELGVKKSLLVLSSLGYTVQSPPIDHLKRDLGHTLVPFRTFRGQFISYCTGSGKWYFKVKLLKGRMSRIGWAIPRYSSSSLLGSDSFSYAIDGHNVVKWHDGLSENFGHILEEGDEITCLLDLDEGTMSFACNDKLLLSLTHQSGIAFSNLPRNEIYVPAVSVFMGEQVQMILTSMKDQETSYSRNMTAGYCSIENDIKVRIPLWYSHVSHQFKDITPSHSYLKITKTKEDELTVSSNEAKLTCLRLNMGVEMTLDKRKDKDDPVDEREGEPEESQNDDDDGEKYSFSVTLPAGEAPSAVYFGWAREDFLYDPKDFHAHSDDLILNANATIELISDSDSPFGDTVFEKFEEIGVKDFSSRGDTMKDGVKRRMNSNSTTSTNKRRSQLESIEEWSVDDDDDDGSTSYRVIGKERVLRKDQCAAYLLKMSALLKVDESVYLATDTQVDCVINPSTGLMMFSCVSYSKDAVFELRVKAPGKLFPILISRPKYLKIGSFSFAPAKGCQPLVKALVGKYYKNTFPNLLPAMKLMSISDSCWYQMDDRSSLYPTESCLYLPNMPSYDIIHLCLPQEGNVMRLTELIESPSLYSFHVETLRTYRACCMHDNSKAAEMVNKIVSWKELAHSIKSSYWSYHLVAESFNLVNTLYLEHKVLEHQLIKQDSIFASDCISCSPSPPPPSSSCNTGRRRSSNSLLNRTVTICCSDTEKEWLSSCHYHQLSVLKDITFQVLDSVILADVMTCRMLSAEYNNCLFLPLLKALDCFLVLGMLQDSERLLSLLHPSLAPSGHKANFYILTMPTRDPQIQSVLCDILDHLCDAQLQGRLNHIIEFASGFVEELQEDQRKRVMESDPNQFLSPLVIQEINTPTEKQLNTLLSFSSDSCLTSQSLKDSLQSFHTDLSSHCNGIPSSLNQTTDSSSVQKLTKLVSLVKSSSSESENSPGASSLHKLRDVIISTVLRWSRGTISDIKMAEKTYKLLYRQFNESEMLRKAIQRTYIVEQFSEFSSGEISKFRSALGKMRKMLVVGFGEEEEPVFQELLHELSTCDLFQRHPDLLRFAGVHSLVINVMKSYFSFSETLSNAFPSSLGTENSGFVGMTQTLKLAVSDEGFADIIEECCEFLCSFAQTSHQNQIALSEHLQYLLDQCLIFSDQVASNNTNPLDVAIATISNNLQLVMALSSEGILHKVVQLMHKMMKYEDEASNTANSTISSPIHKMSVLYGAMPMEWLPTGAEKCLKFLQAAVYVNGETIEENAAAIIRLLIQQPDCLGPCYINQHLSLVKMFSSCFSQINSLKTTKKPKRLTRANSRLTDTIVRLASETELPQVSQSDYRQRSLHRSSTLNLFYKQLSALTSELTVSFYTLLVRVLGLCAPSIDKRKNFSYTVKVKYSTEHILPFLRTLMGLEDLRDLLSLPMNVMPPTHKEALMVFLDRVYSRTDKHLVLDLIREAFLPDIKATIHQAKKTKYDAFVYLRYISCHVLPYLEHQSSTLDLLSEFPLLLNLIHEVYQLISLATDSHRRMIEQFLITMTKTLPPPSILKLLPMIMDDIKDLSKPSFTVALKILTVHHSHHSRYYTTGSVVGQYKLCRPSHKERVYIALLFSWVLKSLCHAKEASISGVINQCLESLACAILPEILVPPIAELRALSVEVATLSPSCTSTPSSTPSPPLEDEGSSLKRIDNNLSTYIGQIEFSSEYHSHVFEFAKFCHENWVYEMQQVNGWSYDHVSNPDTYHDNRLRPFEYINDELGDRVVDEVKQVLQVLLFYGCVFNEGSSGGQLGSIPLKPKLMCLFGANKKKVLRTITADPDTWYSYEPLVVDLDQIELPLHALIIVSSANAIMNHLVTVEEGGDTQSDSGAYDPIRLMYYEKTKRRSYGLVEDFLKFMKVKGLIVANPFAAVPGSMQYMLSKTIDSKPFSLQLFECFLTVLRYECCCTSCHTCRCQSHKQEIFPAFCSYVNTHASYFNPNIEGEERRLTFATLDEKIPLIKLFFEVHSYIGTHLDSFLISTSKTATVAPGEVTTSKGGVSWNTELQAIKERNQKLLNRLMSLSMSLIKVLDVSQFEVLEETKSFFSYVISTLESLGKSLNKIKSNRSNQFDKKLFLYVIHCLAPSLTALFRRCEDIVLSPVNGVVKSRFSDVFSCVFSFVCNEYTVFIESDTLSIIGQCLSEVCLADSKFQCSRFENRLAMLLLKRGALLKLSRPKISFVALVIAPVLANRAIRKVKNGDSNVEVDKVLKLVLRILSEYQDDKEKTWMKDLSCSVCHLASYCSVSVYKTHLIPLLMKMSDRGSRLWQEEQLVTSSLSIKESDLLIKQKQFERRLKLYGQDLVSVLLFFVFLTEKNPSTVADLINKTLFYHTALILNHYFTSQKFSSILNSCSTSFIQNVRGRKPERWNILISFAMTIIRHLPLSAFQFLQQLNPLFDQPGKSSADIDQAILDVMKCLAESDSRAGIDVKLHRGDHDEEKREFLQILLTYKKAPFVIQSFARVQRLMRQIVRPSLIVRERWRDAMSRKKREGIVACLKAVPFHRLKKHRAMNLFLQEYSTSWLSQCHSSNMENLCEEIIDKEEYYQERLASSSVISLINDRYVDPLEQLFSLLGMQASTGQWYGNSTDLYDSFANAVIETFQTMIDDAEELEGNSIYDNFESIRYQVVAKQGLLIKKRVPEMILAILTSSNGKLCPLVHITLKLGIVQLEGGNASAQERIMERVKSLGSEFWTSIACLISQFGTLDWNIYEKSQIVVKDQNNIGERVFPTSDQVLALFRFLQLLCEGHNEGFQNLLRTQGSNAMSTNIVIATVDYLLKLQDSIRDFYWYHAKQDSLELPARETFLLSFKVAKQLFRTLTEYIQGPCVGNQEALAKSRFWDAMGGFLHVFVALQQKLFCYTSHMELLLELLGLQEEYFILLLAMLEGTTKVSAVGEHMLNMLHESDQFLKELITFYNIFIKLKDVSSSKAFKEYDLNKDGLISYQEFEQAMKAQQFYTISEIQYLMKLADTNKDGLLDYQEFTERFYQPTHKLGFHLCALIRQLSDTMPGDSKLKEIEKNCLKLSEYFKDNIGCIEMMGKSGNVERVYFHIKTSHALQWNDPAIKESRHNFLHSFNWTSQKEKLGEFMNFCEDTIFQMTYNDRMFNVEQEEREKRTDNLRKSQFPEAVQCNTRSIFSRAQTKLLSLGITDPGHVYLKAHSILSFIWFTLILGIIVAPFTHLVHCIRVFYDFCFYGGQGPLKHSSSNPSFLKQYLIKYFQPAQFYLPKTIYASKSLRGHLAHSYYMIRYCLVLTTILINFLILISIQADKNEDLVSLNFSIHLHFVLSCLLMVSFWHLKVPLIIFQKEKNIARRLEKHKGSVTSDHFSFFDRLALRSPSFPRRFWDRQIKERVFDKSPSENRTKLANALGIVNKSKFDEVSRYEQLSNAIASLIDVRYQAWRIVMICFSDNMTFRYHLGYCLLSLAGIKCNVFFFSLHLLELTLQSKTLVNVLRSLKINMKQLLMTLVVTSVVIYIYSAVAFSFFRKFYVQEVESGYVRDNCGNMLTCFLFHIDHGLRSGGGIADVILSAFEDQVYLGRLVFDLTYFFVVIVILLAVFQGLIIDAFGELRKKDDLVLEELKNKCFICGLSLADFKNPHEFDTHINRHHSLKDYMFFLLHLISKPDTEFTGQESMIWDLYLEQTWDFFPAGTCFQTHERRASDALAN